MAPNLGGRNDILSFLLLSEVWKLNLTQTSYEHVVSELHYANGIPYSRLLPLFQVPSVQYWLHCVWRSERVCRDRIHRHSWPGGCKHHLPGHHHLAPHRAGGGGHLHQYLRGHKSYNGKFLGYISWRKGNTCLLLNWNFPHLQSNFAGVCDDQDSAVTWLVYWAG